MKLNTYILLVLAALCVLCANTVKSQSYNVNEIGTGLYKIVNRSNDDGVLVIENGLLSFA